jgi:hypothetical protein
LAGPAPITTSTVSPSLSLNPSSGLVLMTLSFSSAWDGPLEKLPVSPAACSAWLASACDRPISLGTATSSLSPPLVSAMVPKVMAASSARTPATTATQNHGLRRRSAAAWPVGGPPYPAVR